jgi:hypothetical protein
MQAPVHRRVVVGRRQAIDVLLAVLASLLFLLGLQLALMYLREDPLSDTRAYYDAAARLNAGVPLYDQPATTNEAAFYRYPPLLAILFRPVAAAFAYETAAVLWGLVCLATFGLTLARIGLRRRRTWLLVGFLGLPIGWSLSIGQAQVPVTLLLALGSPLAIAGAAQLKVFPALVAVWWIGRRDWTSLGRFAGWSALLVAIQFVLEPAGTLAFPATLGLEQVGEVRNWSPYAISPILWGVLVVLGVAAAIRLAPTRYGWVAAVALSILASPRLLFYQLTTFLAASREPDPPAGARP